MAAMKKKSAEEDPWVALWIRARTSTRDLLDRLIFKLWKERGRRPKKVDVLEEAIREKAAKHRVR